MIKNRKELLDEVSAKLRERRRIFLNIVDYVLSEIRPEKLFEKATLKNVKAFEKIILISIGKASKAMAKAALRVLPKKPDKILLADTGHPLPTKTGVLKTQKIIKACKSLGEKDLAVVLISGGGSAMLTAPVPEITLEDKTEVTKSLLRAGASINELNTVRKHLSQVKGGNLAALIYPAAVLGFVISDVVGNDLSAIASGPLSPDPTTFVDAIKIIKKYRVKLPICVKKYLEKGLENKILETPKKESKYFKRVGIKILADHGTVLKTAHKKAKSMGLKTVVNKKLITGEAREAAKTLTKNAKKNTCAIFAGETTVTCKGKGAGGRNQELVLGALRYLKPNQTIISIGTDGVDGMCPEAVAGAIGDIEILENARKQNLKISDYLKRNDSYSFFKTTNGLVRTGATGTNLGDLIMIIA